MKEIGPYSLQFFYLVVKRDSSYWGRTIRKTIGLSKEIGKEKIEAAVKRAIHFNALTFNTLKNIIDRNLQDMELEKTIKNKTEDKTSFFKENDLDRDLNYYQLKNSVL